MTLENLGLSLSMVCSADCVYCPRPHAHRHEVPYMPISLVEKILDESSIYDIARIDVGENGDAFLNPDVVDILRLIRSRTRASLRMFTNFRSFVPDLIDTVLGEGLLDKVITNIDGATPEAYRNVKGLDLDRVEPNILHFLARREELDSPIEFRIQALTINHYTRTVRRVLDREPRHVSADLVDTPDDFEAIVDRWRHRGVDVERSIVTLWVEGDPQKTWRTSPRRLLHRARRRMLPKPCRMLESIRNGLLVAASGQVYLCCADFDCEVVLGDLSRQTVQEVFESDRRRELIAKLERRDFEGVGGPCRNPELCRIYR